MRYYVCDKQTNFKGHHEVHTITCPKIPSKEDRKNVGKFNNCRSAIQSLNELNKGKSFQFIGCYLCCKPCSN